MEYNSVTRIDDLFNLEEQIESRSKKEMLFENVRGLLLGRVMSGMLVKMEKG